MILRGTPREENKLVGETFIPNIDNAEVKALFEQAIVIFKAHEADAETMVGGLMQRQSMVQ